MFFDIITYLPMFTALFWAIILLTNKDKGESAKTLLGVFMLLIFILDLSVMFFYQNENTLYLYTDPINTFCSISSFLMFYWYIKLLTKEPQIDFKNLWLFAPGLFFGLSSTIIYLLMSPDEQMEYINNHIFRYETLNKDSILIKIKLIEFYASKITFIATVVFAVIKCHTLIKNYHIKISNYYSNLKDISINWAQKITNIFIVVGITSIAVNTLNQPFMLNADIAITLASLFFSTTLYFIGFYGYKQDYNISNIEYFSSKKTEQNSNTTLQGKSNEEYQNIIEGIKRSFDKEKIHRQQDLKIVDIAQTLHTNRSYISKIINSEFKCSFIEFVNQHRLLDAKSQLIKKPNQSIIDISHLTGFNSASTFTRVFKQYEGTSPSQYRKNYLKHQNKSELDD